MEDYKEGKKRDYTTIKKGAIVVFVLAFILFNASKLFNYMGTKHTVDTGPDIEGQNMPKSVHDSLVKVVQKKLDAEKLQNDSLNKVIVAKDTDMKKVRDTIAILTKKKTSGAMIGTQQKKKDNTNNSASK